MNRRSLLKTVGLVAIGGVGYHAYSTGMVPRDISSPLDGIDSEPLTTENEIDRAGDFNAGPFDSVVFYESGAAEVYFNVGHNTDRFGVTHSSLEIYEDSFQTWQSPTYEGPVVIGLQSVIEGNGPYPSNQFRIGVYNDPSETIYFGVSWADFSVPDSWYP